jgi:putative transcriptional regulator
VAPGALLVAAPGLSDPNFRRTVVYMIEHRPQGSLGVVLNRPSEVPVQDVLPTWAPLSSRPSAVFVGGPVETETALCLAALRTGQDPDDVDGLISVRGPVALVDLDGDPTDLAPRLRGLRVFAGYSGWATGQLAGEVARGDWIVVPALPDDVVAGSGPELWARVLRRQGMPVALLATFPDDVKLN